MNFGSCSRIATRTAEKICPQQSYQRERAAALIHCVLLSQPDGAGMCWHRGTWEGETAFGSVSSL